MADTLVEACDRPGCTGSYAADGYCDECGHKRPAAKQAAAKPSTVSKPLATGRTTSGRTRGLTVSTPTGSGLGGSSNSTPSGTRSRTVGRGRLGANLVEVPPVPLRDPTTAVMADPQVPESQRYCSSCGEPVGRSRKGKPGRAEGFCPKDRTPFSFVPRLAPGDLVDHRYEILGALAHGGLGWIYLARDRNISESGADRWVVLKGLINTGDADAMAAAMAERRFLVEVDHPNIVKVYDFAQHPDPRTGEMVGYIVMEYVGGRSLKDLALKHTGPDGVRTPLPLDQVLAYGIEVLPALGYLHGRGLLFCDFKPDNVIHAEEQLKLIDLGAVRRIEDQTSPLWGTPGYQAPELETRGASVASDIYTVGRTLAVLSFDFGGFSTRYASSLPDPADVELLAQQESYYRLLLRATHPTPEKRFSSAPDLADQATGVLREVLSMADGAPRPSASTQFTPERLAFGASSIGPSSIAATPTGARQAPATATAPAAMALDGPAVAAALPLPLVDPTDPSAGFLATLGGDAPSVISALRSAPEQSVEVKLRLIRAQAEAGEPAAAAKTLKAAAKAIGDWRVDWYTGVIALAAGKPAEAVTAFDAVYGALPGEPAARLALAAACELAGDRDGAIRRYVSVWRVDHGFVSAAFGLARTLLADGDRAGAVSILDEVPDISSQHVSAQVAAVLCELDTRGGPLAETDLLAASQRLELLRLDQARRATLVVEVLRNALHFLGATVPDTPSIKDGLPPRVPWSKFLQDWLSSRRQQPVAVPAPRKPGAQAAAKLLGGALAETDVRLGLERAYRLLASLEPDPKARCALVDQANAVRPQTVV
jgi:serine/threonine-protein kinase PknG